MTIAVIASLLILFGVLIYYVKFDIDNHKYRETGIISSKFNNLLNMTYNDRMSIKVERNNKIKNKIDKD